jgi:alpha-1,2-mannosyltransferase
MNTAARQRHHAGIRVARPTGSATATQPKAPQQSAKDLPPTSFSHTYFFSYLIGRYYSEPDGWAPNPVTALILLACVRIAAALTNGIADCDETFNYWEPLHRIMYGTGLQTWEYSPEFALRSYAFLFPYAAAGHVGRFLASLFTLTPDLSPKLVVFYSVRIGQALACAVAEVFMYDSCIFQFGKHAGRVFLILLAVSPGMFRASTELLPSSFAMISMMFAFSHWMMGRFGSAIACVAVGAGLGWPFAALLGIPMAFHIVLRRGFVNFTSMAVTSGMLLLAFMVPIDSFYFGRPVVAPLNIIRYNVFPAVGAGPDLFGVEHWSFYVYNLFLNCNLSLLLFVSFPFLWSIDLLLYIVSRAAPQLEQKLRLSRAVFFLPGFIWVLVFLAQPHKEERFLAPIYPLVALVSSIALNDWCVLLFGIARTRRAIVSCAFVLLAAILGLCRVAMQWHSFGAPFQVFTNFGRYELRGGLGPRSSAEAFSSFNEEVNICVGKEWYRFPSSFFLPASRFRVRFTRSSFSGLLPKYFDEEEHGTRTIPRGMNMFNEEDPLQYISEPASHCHYYVDLTFSHRGSDMPGSVLGSSVIEDENPIPKRSRLTLESEPLVDLEYSRPGYRAFWIPSWLSNLPSTVSPSGVVYGKFTVMRNLDLIPVLP